jgi:hypothetical protein
VIVSPYGGMPIYEELLDRPSEFTIKTMMTIDMLLSMVLTPPAHKWLHTYVMFI